MSSQIPNGPEDLVSSTAPVDRLPGRNLVVDAGPLTAVFTAKGCQTFRDAAAWVWQLPYGRNTDRATYHLVLTEGHGTCSTKHALLAALALEQRVVVELRLGLYEMTEVNTPGVGKVLDRTGLSSIPEAHCWLRHRGADIDLTMPPDSPGNPPRSFRQEETITPDQIGAYKLRVHRSYLVDWLARQKRTDISVDDAWRIREACIAALSGEAARMVGH